MTNHPERARRRPVPGLLRTHTRAPAGTDALNLLLEFGNRLRVSPALQKLLDEVLDASLEILGACMGYIRLCPATSGTPVLAAHRGIAPALLDDARASDTAESALCEMALQRGTRIVIADAHNDAAGQLPDQCGATPAGCHALQATPLIDGNGRRLGVLCTHFRHPHTPPVRALRLLDLYLLQATALIGRILAEQERDDGDARLHALAEASPALIWQLSRDGDAVYVNRRFEELTGKRTQELLRCGWHAILHPEDAVAYLAAVGQAQAQRSRLQQRVRLQSCRGCWRLFDVHALPWFSAAGEYAGHIGISIDITDAARLEQTQATYRMATEGGKEGFYILRPLYDRNRAIVDFEFVDSNHCGASYLGHRREKLIGMKMSTLYDGSCTLAQPMQILRQAMKMGFFEDDVEVWRGSPVKLRWVHCKIVRAHGELAITVRDISEAKARVDELERRGNEDDLTGLPNRYWVQHYLPLALERAANSMSELALLFMDLDGFKQVNDTLGHPGGDELLRTAARRLKVAVRPQDKVARLGGDEFVIILENLAQRSDAAHVAQRILRAFEESFTLPQGVQTVGTSIGISLFPADAKDADTLLRHADAAMYSTKNGGKRNYRFFDPASAGHPA